MSGAPVTESEFPIERRFAKNIWSGFPQTSHRFVVTMRTKKVWRALPRHLTTPAEDGSRGRSPHHLPEVVEEVDHAAIPKAPFPPQFPSGKLRREWVWFFGVARFFPQT